MVIGKQRQDASLTVGGHRERLQRFRAVSRGFAIDDDATGRRPVRPRVHHAPGAGADDLLRTHGGDDAVGFPFVILPLYFKYHTLRYRFDDKGIAMTYGILFRRETYLTYRRIQDIHVTRNFVQRWLGLASVAVQTASGSSGAEMTIEGIHEPERLRDFLYRPDARRARRCTTWRRTAARPLHAVRPPSQRRDDEALMTLLRSRFATRFDGCAAVPERPGTGV